MAFGPALLYFLIAYVVIPHNRDEVPFRQFGLNTEQFFTILGELGFYEAAIFEVWKSTVCGIDYDYGTSQGWCVGETQAVETSKLIRYYAKDYLQ